MGTDARTQGNPRDWRSWLKWAGMALGCLGAGASGAILVMPFLDDGELWRDFVTSPGFGGAAAVVAAVIAFGAARLTAKTHEEQAVEDRNQRYTTQRKEQWWARAQWALDQVAKGNYDIGFEVLAALAESEWAQEHESEVVQAATRAVFPVPVQVTAPSTLKRGRMKRGWMKRGWTKLRVRRLGKGGRHHERPETRTDTNG